MSLILEALRKSEAERRRAQAPDLFAQPQLALPRPHPAWPRWARFALAGVGLVALLMLMRAMWPRPETVAATQVPQPTVSKQMPASTASGEAVSTQVATVVAPPPQPRPQPGTLPAPAPARLEQARPATPAVVAAAPAFEQPRMPPEPIADVPAPAPAPTPIPAQAATPGTDTMRLSDLGTEERQQLPALKLSMHMWNDTPAQRFVILDGQRLGEGDRIGDAVVEQITRDGAILDWNGRRLRVSMR